MSVMNQEALISSVVEEVLRRVGPEPAGRSSAPAGAEPGNAAPAVHGPGVFSEVEPAVRTALQAQRQLAAAGLAVRDAICKMFKQVSKQNAESWGRIEFDETKIGRLDHKILKLELLEAVPGVEFLRTPAHSGDQGVSLDEAAPWGVIGVITPVTHSIPTLTSNAISMIAAGNAMVVNPHPGGANCAAMAAAEYNRRIKQEHGIDPLICVVSPPTLRTAEEIFQHESVGLLAVTGGPGVARAALKQRKRAVVAGPGNPPVVVDETADLDNAATSIISGAAFDNNLLCIGEKEVFVVEKVFDQLMQAMRRAGAVELGADQIERLAQVVFSFEKDHYVLNKKYVGADPAALGREVQVDVPAGTDLLFGRSDENSPWVSEEQMTTFVPFVPCRDFDHALELAIKYEHGFGHTAVIHSNDLKNITRMGQAMNTTLFIVNGPSTACLGAGGEGYASYSIATPTGEGVTNPLTFTRFRRFSVSGSMRIV
jgi:aldehyde dehydrogenase